MTVDGSGPDDVVDLFVAAAVAGDREAARRIGVEQVDRVGTIRTIEGLLSPALRRAGDLWFATELPNHGEHRVTSAVDGVLDAVDPRLDQPVDGPRVVVSTGDGDWHGTAARLAGLLLRARGWRVRFVGPSMTAARLDDLLQRADVDVLALSCPVPFHLAGVGRTVVAAHRRGLPVVVGGGAFDHHPGRARRLGADAAPGTLPASGEELSAWLDRVHTEGLARTGPVVSAALELDAAALLRGVLGELDPQGPFAGRALRQDVVRTTVDAWLSAVVVDEPALLAAQLDWVGDYLRARSLPAALLPQLAEALDAHLPVDPGGRLARAVAG